MSYCVYILTNQSHTLYIGITNNLPRRLYEHEIKAVPGFTSRYNITKLIFYEIFDDPETAIAYEKYLKGKTRQKKMAIIKSKNPNFRDLKSDIA